MNKLFKFKILNLCIAASILVNAGFQTVNAAAITHLTTNSNSVVAKQDKATANLSLHSLKEEMEESETIESNSRLIVKYINERGKKMSDKNKISINKHFDVIILDSNIDINSYISAQKEKNHNIEYIQEDYRLILSNSSSDKSDSSILKKAKKFLRKMKKSP